MEDGLYCVELLGNVTDDREERESLLNSLIPVFEEKNNAGKLIATLTYREIQQSSTYYINFHRMIILAILPIP